MSAFLVPYENPDCAAAGDDTPAAFVVPSVVPFTSLQRCTEPCPENRNAHLDVRA
jgi:hypothetical protein